MQMWQALPPEQRLAQAWAQVPASVAASMAFEGEPVSRERLEELHRTATAAPPQPALKFSSMSCPISPRVRMHLEVGGERLPVNQLGPDFALVEAAAPHLPGPATLFVTVDDDLTIRPVFLPEGIRPGSVRTRLALR